MRIRLGLLVLALLCVGIILGSGAAYAQYGQTYGPPPPSPDYGQQNSQYGNYGQYGYGQYGPMTQTLGDRELRNLAAPIALYSDPLIGIILPAATYVDDIIDADRKNLGNNEMAIQRQYWDISVKALAHYPGVVRMMARDPEWTAGLGQAYVYQPQDLMDAIQYLRQRAWDNGVLRSNRWQTVSRSGGYIMIYPAQGNYIYVPQYDPNVVYLSRKPNYGPQLLTFGLGLLIGSWLDNDTDWHRHRIYRQSWGGNNWFGNWSRKNKVDKNNWYNRDQGHSIVGNHDIIRRPVDYGKVKTFKLPGIVGGQPLNYPKGKPGDNRGNNKGDNKPFNNQGGNNQGGDHNRNGGHQGGDNIDHNNN